MVQPTLQEMSLKETHKPRTHDKPKLCQNKFNTFPNHLKVGDKVLLDAADPHIVSTKLNEEIPLTILSIFPFGTVEVSHPKFGTFKVYHTDTAKHTGVLMMCENWAKISPTRATTNRHGRMTWSVTMSSSRGKKTTVLAPKKRKGASSSSGPTAEIRHHFLQFPIGPQEELFQILQARPLITGCCIDWAVVEQASARPPSLRYLHDILAHTLTGRRESTGVISTHDAYFIWCMSHGHVIDLAYFITLAIQHQTERHRKGVISIGPYVTWLAEHFGLLNTAAQESSLTLIGQMSPQGISSMLSMRMIEKRR
ncbi:hypothetical protein GOBAR_AA00977 [Gossypium barbadense]|uniref:Uncharacterized protein n=1 Tax=Gossypium barbadense TaxID=3634 RepID=A0A2P5YVM6_GOSBA|nr:hypothetical protein GOBAR_AA00977 [Gossypium barbadense]